MIKQLVLGIAVQQITYTHVSTDLVIGEELAAADTVTVILARKQFSQMTTNM